MKSLVKSTAILVLSGSISLCGGTRLSRAAIADDLDAVKACVTAGENVNEFDKWGWTPLMWAVWYRSPHITQYLLANGADPNIQATKGYGFMLKGSTSILLVAYYGLDDLAEMLIKGGANPTLTDSSGRDAFEYARKWGFTSTIAVMEQWHAKDPQ